MQKVSQVASDRKRNRRMPKKREELPGPKDKFFLVKRSLLRLKGSVSVGCCLVALVLAKSGRLPLLLVAASAKHTYRTPDGPSILQLPKMTL